jgi:uncharacterized RDD family membrane protein YckC
VSNPSNTTAPAAEQEKPTISASLGRRFGALVIDWLLCVGVSLFFAPMTRVGFIPVGILVLEYTFFIGLFTQTPGMRLLGLKCVSFATGGRLGIPRAFVRGVLLALVLPPILMDSQQRGLHDRLAGSVMVDSRSERG